MIEEENINECKHFYISYTSADQQWAEWIATQLEDAEYKTIVQAWDFRPGSNFVLEMNNAIQHADRTLLVLSPSYLRSNAFAEWAVAFREDPKGRQGRLLPVRVVLCNLQGLLGSIVPIDLVGLDQERASQRLLAGVLQTRARPGHAPFPGVSSSSGQTEFSVIPDAQFALWIKQIETLLLVQDYDAAYSTVDGILRNYYGDLTARQRARLKYMHGLIYLKGRRPRNLLHSVVDAASSLISQAACEQPSQYAYAAILATIEFDSAQTGLPKENSHLNALIGQAEKLRAQATPEDKEIIKLFVTVQAELYKDFYRLF